MHASLNEKARTKRVIALGHVAERNAVDLLLIPDPVVIFESRRRKTAPAHQVAPKLNEKIAA